MHGGNFSKKYSTFRFKKKCKSCQIKKSVIKKMNLKEVLLNLNTNFNVNMLTRRKRLNMNILFIFLLQMKNIAFMKKNF